MSGTKGKSGVYKRTKKNLKNLRKSHLGKKFSKKHKKKMSEVHKGKKHSKETCKKIKEAQIGKPRLYSRGKKHYNWKGNYELKRQIRNCFKYWKWRSKVFERDNWTCQTCGKRGCYLEAHHIKRFVDILKDNNIDTLKKALKCKELWDISIGVTLCEDCHNLTKK